MTKSNVFQQGVFPPFATFHHNRDDFHCDIHISGRPPSSVCDDVIITASGNGNRMSWCQRVLNFHVGWFDSFRASLTYMYTRPARDKQTNIVMLPFTSWGDGVTVCDEGRKKSVVEIVMKQIKSHKNLPRPGDKDSDGLIAYVVN